MNGRRRPPAIVPQHTPRTMWFMPLLFAAVALLLWLLPMPPDSGRNISIRTFEVPEFPIVVVLEQDHGTITSAWLRTPAGARKLDKLDGLSFVSDEKILTRADHDAKNDLLWRMSFTNLEGDGIHLWIGMTTWSPTVYLSSAPFRYTRWHALPVKIDVPKGTSLYIAPDTPFYTRLENQYSGTETYSFIYTIMLTPEGPAFVPMPSVYKQLSPLLKAGMKGEVSKNKRAVYVRMLSEFDRLADGKAPQTETILNFPMERVDTLTWRK